MDSGVITSPYIGPVADLVDPYATKEGQGSRDAIAYVRSWLREHPGRWAMFSEGDLGVDRMSMVSAGFEVAQRTSSGGVRRVYARLPHPEGESLEEALARGRGGRAVYPSDLPDLLKDSFNWTKEELEMACRTARENLFPVRAVRGPGKKRK